jgi:hypothetical protein
VCGLGVAGHEPAGTPTTRRAAWAWRAVDVAVPAAIACVRIGAWTLDPRAAPRMLSNDYVTYIVAPNYLRSAPVLSIPIGRVPGYLAPVGSSLGLSDASPILTPVYRLANALSPDRPVQLLGWQLVVAYVLMFVVGVAFLQRMRTAIGGAATDVLSMVETRVVAAMLLFVPFFQSGLAHVALMQQWLIVAALYLALFRADANRANTRLGVGVVLLTALVHPYLLPPVVVIGVPYLVRLARARWSEACVAGLVMVAGIGVAGVLMGYIGGGPTIANGGYGTYSADLAFLVSTEGTSRSLQALPFAPADTIEGLGFVGLGAICLVIAAVTAAVMGQRLDRTLRRRLAWLLVATGALAVFATFPVVHLAGRELVDLTHTPFSLTFVGDVFRSNGRFVWALGYLVVLASAGFVLAIPSRARLLVLVPAVVLQAVDVVPYVIPRTDPAPYEQAVGVLRDEQSRAATSVQVMPPWIQYECVPPEIDYADLAPVLLAASVTGLPVNSGYPARPSDAFATRICADESAEFVRGDLRPDVVYVVNAAAALPPELACRPLSGALVACRMTAP